MPQPGQSGTTLHTPPAVPDDLETFSHTGVVPTTYAQLNFSQGTSLVQREHEHPGAPGERVDVVPGAGVAARRQRSVRQRAAAGWSAARTEIFVGAFASRYGSPGEYDEGRYGTPLIARVNGVGERISVRARVRRTGC